MKRSRTSSDAFQTRHNIKKSMKYHLGI